MLERLLLPDTHAIAILLKDHDRVKALFDRFEQTTTSAGREPIIAEAVTELKIHAAIEEEIFYPAVRKHVGQDLMNEADEEHHVARVLIAELDRGGRQNDHRTAKFTVLAESVRHHIKEEEGEMLPKAKELKIDFEALGAAHAGAAAESQARRHSGRCRTRDGGRGSRCRYAGGHRETTLDGRTKEGHTKEIAAAIPQEQPRPIQPIAHAA